jgi:hypothetical protein
MDEKILFGPCQRRNFSLKLSLLNGRRPKLWDFPSSTCKLRIKNFQFAISFIASAISGTWFTRFSMSAMIYSTLNIIN